MPAQKRIAMQSLGSLTFVSNKPRCPVPKGRQTVAYPTGSKFTPQRSDGQTAPVMQWLRG